MPKYDGLFTDAINNSTKHQFTFPKKLAVGDEVYSTQVGLDPNDVKVDVWEVSKVDGNRVDLRPWPKSEHESQAADSSSSESDPW